MSDNPHNKSIEELETEIIGLKIRLRRIEDFLRDMPSLDMYLTDENDEYEDDLYKNAVKIVVQYDRASASLLQRRLSVGYARAARLIDLLETKEVIGKADGSKPREVLKHDVEKILSEEEQEDSD